MIPYSNLDFENEKNMNRVDDEYSDYQQYKEVENMKKLEEIKNNLKILKEKEMSESLKEWKEGYIEGLKRAIAIIEND